MDIPSSFRAAESALRQGIVSYGRSQSFKSGASFSSHDAADDFNSDEDLNDDTDRLGADIVVGDTTPTRVSSISNISFTAPLVNSPPPLEEHFDVASLSTSERTPLLRGHNQSTFKSSSVPVTRQNSLMLGNKNAELYSTPSKKRRRSSALTATSAPSTLRRRSSAQLGSRPKGQSTFGQSLFNCTAMLLGVGILSEPFAFASAGWIGGTTFTIGFGLLTCYTAKILARMIYADPNLKTYTDCIRKAYGPRSTALAAIFFILELFAVSVVLVVLFSDSLHSILPQYSTTTYAILSLFFLIPSAFLPLSFISYTSLVSVFATIFIGIVLVIDGLSKTTAPGSLWESMRTDWLPGGVFDEHGTGAANGASVGEMSTALGLSCGIIMAGFGGHAVVPSIALDMQNPEDFDSMIHWAFFITTTVYGIIGACGYIMFGRNVTDEVSRNLVMTPGYNVPLTKAGLWMMVISPITKFALASRPLNVIVENYFDIEPSTFLSFSSLVSLLPSHRRSSEGAISSTTAQEEESLLRRSRRTMSSSALLATVSDGDGLECGPNVSALERGNGNGSLSEYGTRGVGAKGKEESASKRPRKVLLFVFERLAVVLSIVATAILVPKFGLVMSLLGALCAFAICATGPLAAQVAVNGGGWGSWSWRNAFDGGLCLLSVVIGVWGTVSAVVYQAQQGF